MNLNMRFDLDYCLTSIISSKTLILMFLIFIYLLQVFICVLVVVHFCICVHIGQRSMLGYLLSYSPAYFLRHCFNLSQTLHTWLAWLARACQGPALPVSTFPKLERNAAFLLLFSFPLLLSPPSPPSSPSPCPSPSLFLLPLPLPPSSYFHISNGLMSGLFASLLASVINACFLSCIDRKALSS